MNGLNDREVGGVPSVVFSVKLGAGLRKILSSGDGPEQERWTM